MDSSIRIESSSPQTTQQIAQSLARFLKGGEVITLSGDLGAGKTCFTQGLAMGLGVERQVNSPTFTLIKEYQGQQLNLYHMDVYRVEDEWEELGLEEYFYGQGVTVVEWPQQIAAQLPPERLEIVIRKQGDNLRQLHFIPLGKKYERLLNEVFT